MLFDCYCWIPSVSFSRKPCISCSPWFLTVFILICTLVINAARNIAAQVGFVVPRIKKLWGCGSQGICGKSSCTSLLIFCGHTDINLYGLNLEGCALKPIMSICSYQFEGLSMFALWKLVIFRNLSRRLLTV